MAPAENALVWSLGLQRTNSEIVSAPKETKIGTKQEANVSTQMGLLYCLLLKQSLLVTSMHTELALKLFEVNGSISVLKFRGPMKKTILTTGRFTRKRKKHLSLTFIGHICKETLDSPFHVKKQQQKPS